MDCIKHATRSCTSLFKVYLCDYCVHKQSDEFFVIGTNALYIYCINQCSKVEIDDQVILFNDKVKLLLRDFCIHCQDNILLWMDYIEPLEYYGASLEILLMMGMNIHILKW